MSVRSRLRLRTRIILVVLLGGVAPLAISGWWILSAARQGGEAVLRDRLDETLGELYRDVGLNWIPVRSTLLDLTETSYVQTAVRSGQNGGAPLSPAVLFEGLSPLGDLIENVTVRDHSGALVLEAIRPPTSSHGPRFLLPPVTLPVRPPGSAEVIGSVEVWFDARALLSESKLTQGLSGAVLAVLDVDDDRSYLPLAMGPDLLRSDRFTWGGEEWITTRMTLQDPGYELVMAGPLTRFFAPLEGAESQALTSLLVAIAVGVMLSLLLAGRLSGSLESLADAADRISTGELSVRVEEAGPDEVARVGRAFNQMTRNLEATLERAAQREALAAVGEFAGSLAHEIRNPLTSVRLDLERAAERLHQEGREGKLVARALRELKRLDRSVEGALRLARSGRVKRERVALDVPIRAAMESVVSAFEKKGCTLEVDDSSDTAPLVLGDSSSLQQILVNLLENAASALEEGGRAGIRVGVEEGEAWIEVWDTGRGMTTEQLSRATEVLFSTRSEGTGLGLPIAQSIARAHGGTLQLRSAPGVGTTARLTLPRLGSDAADRQV